RADGDAAPPDRRGRYQGDGRAAGTLGGVHLCWLLLKSGWNQLNRRRCRRCAVVMAAVWRRSGTRHGEGEARPLARLAGGGKGAAVRLHELGRDGRSEERRVGKEW